jgi:hypothetical protein
MSDEEPWVSNFLGREIHRYPTGKIQIIPIIPNVWW